MNSVKELPDRSRPVPHRITNCHAHTFTHEHSPDRFLPRPIVPLTNFGPFPAPVHLAGTKCLG